MTDIRKIYNFIVKWMIIEYNGVFLDMFTSIAEWHAYYGLIVYIRDRTDEIEAF